MGKKTLWFSILSLVLVLSFFEFTNADLSLQVHLFDANKKEWFFQDPHNLYRAIFYTGTKILVAIIAVCVLIASLISWKKNKWKEYRKGFVIVLTTTIFLPTSIAVVGKKATNVQCPDDVSNFRGIIPYVKLFEHYPKNPATTDGKWVHGNCFPAGHASGGFALMSLYLLFRSRKNKQLGLLFGIGLGWIMGMYQVVRGMHFLSHHIITMILALLFISLLNLFIKDKNHESSQS